jgi:membrane-associated phospholipid phosphatase
VPDVIDTFDRRVDDVAGRLRGNRLADTVAYGASALGDHGLIWFLIALARGTRPGRRRAVAVRAVVFSGVVTPAVNLALKRAVGRRRPPSRWSHPLPVRVPASASFPSGHALAAWCAATLLADGDPLAPAYYTLAAVVSGSRVHVGLHHASDVIAGSLLGLCLGRLGRLAFPLGRADG